MPDKDEAATRYVVPGLERGLRLLQLFDRTQTMLGAPEIARALELPRSTVFRIIQTLESLSFLERTGDAKYRLGAAVLRLGFEYIASLEITDVARPIVERLSADTGYSAQLAIRDGRDVVVVVKAQSPAVFSSNVRVGTRLPAHATALGRALLAELDESQLLALYPEPRLASFSPHTPKTLADLLRQLRADRTRGYSISEAQYERSVSTIVAPVRDGSGTVTASLSVTLHQSTIEPELRERLVRATLEAAAELSHRLNFRSTETAAAAAA